MYFYGLKSFTSKLKKKWYNQIAGYLRFFSKFGGIFMAITYVQSHSGVISAFVKGKPIVIAPDHLFYSRVIQAISENDEEKFLRFTNINNSISSIFVDENKEQCFFIKGDDIYFKNVLIPSSMLQKMIGILDVNELDYFRIIRFLNKLIHPDISLENASLCVSLLEKDFPLIDDGCFLAFIKVKNDWTDFEKGTIDHSFGKQVVASEGSSGLTVGSLKFIKNHHSHILGHYLLVKVDPTHIISVKGESAIVREYVVLREINLADASKVQKELYNLVGDFKFSRINQPISEPTTIKEWCDYTCFDHEYFLNEKVEVSYKTKNFVQLIQKLYGLSLIKNDAFSRRVLENLKHQKTLKILLKASEGETCDSQ